MKSLRFTVGHNRGTSAAAAETLLVWTELIEGLDQLPDGERLVEIDAHQTETRMKNLPNRRNGGSKGFGLFLLAELFSHEITIDEPFVVDRDGNEQCVGHGSVQECVHDNGQNAALWHTRFAGSRSTTFDKKLQIVTGRQRMLNVGVENGSIDMIFLADHRIDFAFDEKRSQIPKHTPGGDGNFKVKKPFL